jgi:hypothetical protein
MARSFKPHANSLLTPAAKSLMAVARISASTMSFSFCVIFIFFCAIGSPLPFCCCDGHGRAIEGCCGHLIRLRVSG